MLGPWSQRQIGGLQRVRETKWGGKCCAPKTFPTVGTSVPRTPTQSKLSAYETTPHLLTIPYDGLNPTTPQYDAGNRIEPPVSVPSALFQNQSSASLNRPSEKRTHASQRPIATAAALPPELPPAYRFSNALPEVRGKGFSAGPWMEYLFSDLPYEMSPRAARRKRGTHPMPNSSQLVFPTMSAPSSRSLCTTVASNGETYADSKGQRRPVPCT